MKNRNIFVHDDESSEEYFHNWKAYQGKLDDEYQLYVEMVGIENAKSFDEWLES